jgi:Na+-driven multidrug efflux pump
LEGYVEHKSDIIISLTTYATLISRIVESALIVGAVYRGKLPGAGGVKALSSFSKARSGGDSKFVFMMEASSTWLLGVPLGLLLSWGWKQPLPWVYFFLSLEEAVRLVIGYVQLLAITG